MFISDEQMYKGRDDKLKARRKRSFDKNLAKLNREDKSGNHRPRRPVKQKKLIPEDIDFTNL